MTDAVNTRSKPMNISEWYKTISVNKRLLEKLVERYDFSQDMKISENLTRKERKGPDEFVKLVCCAMGTGLIII